MFKTRRDAAIKLSTKLMDLYAKDVVVLGISAGGMLVADELAHELNLRADMLVVRKLRVPDHRTEPMGAIALGGETVFNTGIIEHFKVSQEVLNATERDERKNLLAEDAQFHDDANPMLDVANKIVLLVDDGMSTGVTMRAAIDAMKAQSAREIIVASPVSSTQVCMMFHGVADRTICFATPQPFQSVANWYENFEKPSNDEIRNLILKNRAELAL